MILKLLWYTFMYSIVSAASKGLNATINPFDITNKPKTTAICFLDTLTYAHKIEKQTQMAM